MFIYDGGVIDQQFIALAVDELLSFSFVQPSDLEHHLVPRLARRMTAAVQAVEEGWVVEMEHGEVVGHHRP